ncbi:MAG TPA: 50S ribosomal protein L16 [Phycisphaerae bacterium]|jgi:large subunit ribosomal protein L16|nr:50S ribosomal protein L16 [Phycisphaerae bacterium]HOB75750.1 50S ribosomal protein L16 [Phycisphaerae bacterium]HOJ55618.1 50S ribosomal protein L16 [Phycisphaerae bacterium]HOL27686.1 50S ribosomal protein L16 [Phycisphaerae bacterium]HPP21932.1 50S ribosomal protein L16 [Phycisphaerae bacterium]
MALMPKRMKYRKAQRGSCRQKAMRGNKVSFGEFGIQSLESGWLTARQIEAGRMAATHYLAREGRVYIRVFPHKPVSTKPLETRMGKGKGEPEYYVAQIGEGTVLFEIGGVSEEVARSAFTRVAHKMPFRCRFVKRHRAV